MVQALVDSAKKGEIVIPNGAKLDALSLADNWLLEDQGSRTFKLFNNYSNIVVKYDPRNKETEVYDSTGRGETYYLESLSVSDILKAASNFKSMTSLTKDAATAFVASVKKGKLTAR